MTLCIVVRGPEGLVLAAESRTTALIESPFGPLLAHMDDTAVKLLSFQEPNTAVGAVIHGSGAIDQKHLSSFIPDFEAALPENRLSVQNFAQHLSDYFTQKWQAAMPTNFEGPDISFIVAGFDQGKSGSHVLSFDTPGNPVAVEKNADFKGRNIEVFVGGQRAFIDRLVRGFDQGLLEIVSRHCAFQPQESQSLLEALKPLEISLQARSLQEYVILATFLIQTSIDAEQKLTPWRTSCGGSIDIATITRWGCLKFIQRK